MASEHAADHPRPWVDHYPEGIIWDATLNLTPVHEQVLSACARIPDKVALDFLELSRAHTRSACLVAGLTP